MPSITEIANRALTKIGSARITSLDDGTERATVLNSMFQMVFDAELRRNNWKFAIKRTSLSALVEAPAWGYSYAYPLPSDFLKIVQVNDFYVRGLKQKAPWSVEAGQILTDYTAPLKLRYVMKVTNLELLDPLFVEVFACKLAFEACEAITQSSSKKQTAFDEYRYAIREAMFLDAIENPPDELPWGSWLDSREGMVTTSTGPSANSVADLSSGWGVL